jgi:hypothetical protein
MAETSSSAQPGSSGGQPQQAEPALDEEVFDMNNNDPNNNTEFNEQPEVIEEFDNEEVKAEDIQFKLLNEARAIHGVLSRYSINEIYSYLEASIDHPQRMQFVMNGFLTRDATEGDNAVVVPDEVPAVVGNKRTTNSSSSDSPAAKREKLFDLNDSANSNSSDDSALRHYGPDLNETVYLSSSDDEADLPVKAPSKPTSPPPPLPPPIPEVNDVPVVEDEVRKGQIQYLQEMFPKMDPKILEARYMDILVAQMLDIQEANIPAIVEEPAPVVPEFIAVPQQQPGPSTTNTKAVPQQQPGPSTTNTKPIDNPEVNVIRNDTRVNNNNNSAPSSSKDPVPSISAGPSNNPLLRTNHKTELSIRNPAPSTSIEAGPSTSKDVDPGIDDMAEEPWDELDGDTVSVAPEIQQQMSYLMAVLPNADPTFLQQKCVEFKDNNNAMEAFITDAMENKNYPTLADYNKREEENKELKKFTGRLNVKDFLESFPDPETTFGNKEHKNDFEYIERTTFYLLGRFRNVSKVSITNAIKRNNNLTKAVEQLSKGIGVSYLKKARPVVKEPVHLKDCKHLPFLQEVCCSIFILVIHKYNLAHKLLKKCVCLR